MFSSPQANPNIPAFIGKLWHMVSNPKSDHLICWNKDGSSFLIKNNANFSSELLPMYYKHNNLASFIRQLNKYGFHKVMSVDSANSEKSDFEFAHPDFVKGCPQLLLQIKRKLSNSKETEFKNDSNMVVSKLLQDVQQLQAKQDLFESKLAVMKNENDALWREHSILRQRHQKQQKIVNKLIQFLVTLVQQTRGLNIKRRMPLMLKDGRPAEHLMAIKDSDRSNTPLICEVDPYDVFLENGNNTSSTSNSTNRVPIQIGAVSNPIVTKDSSTSTAIKDTYLNDSLTSSSPLSNIDFAVPLQEVSPAIVQISKPVNYNTTVSANTIRGTNNTSGAQIVAANNDNRISKQKIVTATLQNQSNQINSFKKPIKRKSSANKSNKSNYLLVIPELTSETPRDNQESLDVSLEDPLLVKTTDLTPKFTPDKIPRVEMDNHLDMVQTDLEVLKDILHSEGLSLDASTLMSLFGSDDLLSLNLPEAGKNLNDDPTENCSEIVSYSPNFIDMNDILDENTQDFSNVTMPSLRELNTPLVELDTSPAYIVTSPTPCKRSKK